MVWTNHRNLGSEEAKPETGSKNVKVDTLSRLYDAEDREGEETPIIPSSRIITPVVWDIDADVRNPHLHSARRTAHTCPRVCHGSCCCSFHSPAPEVYVTGLLCFTELDSLPPTPDCLVSLSTPGSHSP